jgi:hypothetical protein
LWNYPSLLYKHAWCIRSIDSAKPYVYAGAGITLNMRDMPPEYPGRKPTYFQDTITDTRAMFRNMEFFTGMVRHAMREE